MKSGIRIPGIPHRSGLGTGCPTVPSRSVLEIFEFLNFFEYVSSVYDVLATKTGDQLKTAPYSLLGRQRLQLAYPSPTYT